MTDNSVLKLFEEHRALLKGHFKLSSGLHSNGYLQCALILQYPELAEKIAKAIAKKFSKEHIDVVAGPALGGITLAYELSRALGARGIFTERVDGAMALRRGFIVEKGERVLVAEDVVTTGSSTKEVIAAVRDPGGVVVAVACIIDRSSGAGVFDVRFEALAKVDLQTFEEKGCPLCKEGIPIVKPGSRSEAKRTG